MNQINATSEDSLPFRARQPGYRHWNLLWLAGIACLVSSLVLGYFAFRQSGQLTSAPLPAAPFGPTKPPDGTVFSPPTELGPDTVAIPELGILATIESTGFSSSRRMILPEPAKVSHLDNNVNFGGDAGTNLVAGHVDDGGGKHGAFWPLHTIRPGTPIYVTDQRGNLWTYVTTALEIVRKNELPENIFSSGGSPRLILVTCGGTTIPDATFSSGFTYEDNVMVTAIPVTTSSPGGVHEK